LPGAIYFRDFNEAPDMAESELTGIVREIAQASGTEETAVTIPTQDFIQTGTNGDRTILGCSLLAELKGEPSYGFLIPDFQLATCDLQPESSARPELSE
jgi:hypothetical protein